jgi:glycosyltransferase involved in cell wall biosynthesis
VHFPGWVDQADLPEIYHAAEAFLFPSVYEEFGIPVVEAMACGCPVVSSNTGAIPELADGCALLAAPFDSEAMAANLARLLAEPSLAKELRDKGLERAKQFSWSEAARRTLEIFRKVHGVPAKGAAR